MIKKKTKFSRELHHPTGFPSRRHHLFPLHSQKQNHTMSSFSGEQTPKLPVRRSMQIFDANPVSLSSTRSKTLVRATSCPLDQDSYSSSSDVNSPAPHWVRDGTAHACSQCDQKFSSFCRRHHCRLCGDVYCHKCCNKYRRTPYYLSPVRERTYFLYIVSSLLLNLFLLLCSFSNEHNFWFTYK